MQSQAANLEEVLDDLTFHGLEVEPAPGGIRAYCYATETWVEGELAVAAALADALFYGFTGDPIAFLRTKGAA